jgi:hypothetical protein
MIQIVDLLANTLWNSEFPLCSGLFHNILPQKILCLQGCCSKNHLFRRPSNSVQHRSISCSKHDPELISWPLFVSVRLRGKKKWPQRPQDTKQVLKCFANCCKVKPSVPQNIEFVTNSLYMKRLFQASPFSQPKMHKKQHNNNRHNTGSHNNAPMKLQFLILKN